MILAEKVLIIDDDLATCTKLREMCKNMGYSVIEATSGQEGLEFLRGEAPDFVLTDLQPPEMDGIEFISALKAINPETPVIVLSHTATLRDAFEAIRHGAWDYLTKPVPDQDEVDIVIKRTLERAQLLTENRTYREHLEDIVQERTRQLKAREEEIQALNIELEKRVAARTEELHQLNNQLESFTFSVSHDLRAPLRHIDGFTKALLEEYYDKLDETAKNYMDRINTGCERMNMLIEDLLVLSRCTRQAINKVAVDTVRMVKEVYRELCVGHDERRVDLSLGILPSCSADPPLLQQVFSNLLGNALKYTGKREVARIEIGAFEQNQKTVFFVRDNGAGFDMQYADKLFGVFQRLHSNKDFEGTGVGLAIVQNIIQRHGGRIWAEAEVDKGATFCFTLE